MVKVYVISAGVVSSGVTLGAGDDMQILSGGLAVATAIAGGGEQDISSGGVASSTVMSGSSASQIVYAGGTAIGTEVDSGGILTVGYAASAGASLASGTEVQSGGNVENDGGSLDGTTILGGGLVKNYGGNSGIGDVRTTVDSGGGEDLGAAGTSLSTTVSSGGFEIISNGGTAIALTLDTGASLVVLSGGVVNGLIGAAGAQVISTGVIGIQPDGLLSNYGGIASGVITSAGGSALVLSGGVYDNAVVSAGGSLTIDAGETTGGMLYGQGEILGGRVNALTVAASGSLVIGGGTVSCLSVLGGSADLLGGTASGVPISNGIPSADVAYSVISGVALEGDATLAEGGLFGSSGIVGAVSFTNVSNTLVIEGAGGQVLSGATLTGFGATDKIVLQNTLHNPSDAASWKASAEQLMVSAGGTTTAFALAGDYSSATFNVSAYLGFETEVTVNVPCFAIGIRLATEHGPVAIEAPKPGDRLLTLGDAPRPVRFIGRRRVDCAAHPEPRSVWPVRSSAGAFGHGVPARDLYLSPDHTVFAEGVLIPVRQLINGGSVSQRAVAEVTYLHVELDGHDVILAEDLPTESYLDLGDRGAFSNHDGAVQLFPTFGTADVALLQDAVTCAAFQVAGQSVDRAKAPLAARATPPPSTRSA